MRDRNPLLILCRAVIVPLLITLVACGPAAAIPSAPFTGPTSPEVSPQARGVPTAVPVLTKISVTYSNIVALELPVWSASEGGFFQKHGLDVDLRLAESSQGMAALLSGQIQIADIAGGQTISAVAGGADVVDVAEFGPVYPFVFLVAPEIKSMADLKGKKVGVSSVGSASDIATRVLLLREGLVPDQDVAIIAVGSATARTAALQNGAIQGGVQLPPDQISLEAQGFHVLFDMADLKLPNSNVTEVVLRAYMNEHPDVVQAYIDSLIEAVVRLRADKPFGIAVLKKYFKSEDDALMGVAYDYAISKVIPVLPYPRAEQLQDAKDTLAARNEKVREVDLSSVVNPAFVQSAADRGLDRGPSPTQ